MARSPYFDRTDSPHSDILIEGHESRIIELERSYSLLSAQLLPAIARLEQTMLHSVSRVDEKLDVIGDRLEKIETSDRHDSLKNVERDVVIRGLQESHAESKEFGKKLRWQLLLAAGAGVGTIVLAAVLTVLGLK